MLLLLLSTCLPMMAQTYANSYLCSPWVDTNGNGRLVCTLQITQYGNGCVYWNPYYGGWQQIPDCSNSQHTTTLNNFLYSGIDGSVGATTTYPHGMGDTFTDSSTTSAHMDSHHGVTAPEGFSPDIGQVFCSHNAMMDQFTPTSEDYWISETTATTNFGSPYTSGSNCGVATTCGGMWATCNNPDGLQWSLMRQSGYRSPLEHFVTGATPVSVLLG